MKKNKFIVCLFIAILVVIIYSIILEITKDKDADIEISGNGCVILCYHRVLPTNKPIDILYRILRNYTNDNELKLYSVSGGDFIEQIKYLKDNDIKILSLEDLEYHIYNKIELPTKSIIITFDDIDESVYKNAFPVLKEYKVPFSLFIISGHVGNKDFKSLRLATWDEIKDMYDSDLASIGLHTHNFHYLDKKNNPPFIYPENAYEFYKDTLLGIITIKENLGIKPRYFSYPYGFGTPETDEYLLKSDMKLIFTLKPGVVTKDDKTFFIKRILVHDGNWKNIKKWIEEQ